MADGDYPPTQMLTTPRGRGMSFPFPGYYGGTFIPEHDYRALEKKCLEFSRNLQHKRVAAYLKPPEPEEPEPGPRYIIPEHIPERVTKTFSIWDFIEETE